MRRIAGPLALLTALITLIDVPVFPAEVVATISSTTAPSWARGIAGFEFPGYRAVRDQFCASR